MSAPYKAATADPMVGDWPGLADDLKPGYTEIRNAVMRINEKLIKQGAKHKLVYTDKMPHYSYRSY